MRFLSQVARRSWTGCLSDHLDMDRLGTAVHSGERSGARRRAGEVGRLCPENEGAGGRGGREKYAFNLFFLEYRTVTVVDVRDTLPALGHLPDHGNHVGSV